MALVGSPNRLRVTQSLGEFPHVGLMTTWFLSVTEKRVCPPALQAASGADTGCGESKWRLLYSQCCTGETGQLVLEKPELLDALQTRGFTEQKSWVRGSGSWAVLIGQFLLKLQPPDFFSTPGGILSGFPWLWEITHLGVVSQRYYPKNSKKRTELCIPCFTLYVLLLS